MTFSRKIFPLTLLIFIFFSRANFMQAQVELDFSGYLYELPSLQKSPPEFSDIINRENPEGCFLLNLTRLRLTPTLNISEASRVTLHYEMDMLATKTPIPYFEGTGKTNRQAISLNWRLKNEERFKLWHYIDRLYYKHSFDWGELVAGRQRISWGVGRIWRPTDLFNPINPANFSKIEKDGADALSVKYFLGDFSDLQIVWNLRERWDEGNYGLRLRTNLMKYDVSAVGGYFDGRAVFGGDFAGNLWDAGFRGEGIFSAKNDGGGDSFFKFILGIDYQFSADFYSLIEYHHNGEGTTDKGKYLLSFDRLIKGEIQNLGKDYLALMATYQIHPLVSASLTSMANLNDRSSMIGLTANYSALENLNLSLAYMLFSGGPLSEYWYYSTAVYMTGQYYF